ncbi:MAG: hypothetical protein JWO75_1139, partial [Actinomycetia bacterium]|nr:hypothetical protein [Actinomycetes bacterium]
MYPPPSGREGVSGLKVSMPNGAEAPGNVSIWPTVAPPDPVPIMGSTSDAGSLTRPLGVGTALAVPGAAV